MNEKGNRSVNSSRGNYVRHDNCCRVHVSTMIKLPFKFVPNAVGKIRLNTNI